MNFKQEMLDRLPSFQARASECLESKFYPLPLTENFMAAEQLHIHQAVGDCKRQYVDIVDFWLCSLFNFLEDLFEESEFERVAAQSQWRQVETGELLSPTDPLFQKFQTLLLPLDEHGLITEAYQMLRQDNVRAFTFEANFAYLSFFWRSPHPNLTSI